MTATECGLKQGDVVNLKSGGPRLTIALVVETEEQAREIWKASEGNLDIPIGWVRVFWFNKEYNFCTEWLDPILLEKQ